MGASSGAGSGEGASVVYNKEKWEKKSNEDRTKRRKKFFEKYSPIPNLLEKLQIKIT